MNLRRVGSSVSVLYSIKDHMCVYYLGISIGCISHEKLTAWVDSFIEKSTTPIPGELVEVSLLSQKTAHEIVSSLDKIFRFEYQHTMVAVRVLLGMFYQELKNKTQASDLVILFMHKLMCFIPRAYQMCDEYSFLSITTTYYGLAQEGVLSSVEEVIAESILTLQPYEHYVLLFEQFSGIELSGQV